MKLFIPFAITGAVLLLASCHRSPQSVPEKMNPAVILMYNPGEQLDINQQKERLRIGRILKPVIQGDSLSLNYTLADLQDKNIAPLYYEHTFDIIHLFNRYLSSIKNPNKQDIITFYNQNFSIEDAVLTSLIKTKSNLYYLDINQEDVMRIGINPEKFDQYQEMIRSNNAIITQNTNTIFLAPEISSIFFPTGAMYMLLDSISYQQMMTEIANINHIYSLKTH